MRRNSNFAPTARSRLALCALVAGLAVCRGAWGDEPDSLAQVQATEVRLIRALVDQGVLTKEKARALLQQAGISPALLESSDWPVTPAAPAKSPAVPDSAPIINDATRRGILDEVRQEVKAQASAEGRANAATLPAWVRNMSFGGDIRLRYLRNDFASDNSAPVLVNSWYQLPAQSITDSTDSHERLQMRARLDVTTRINPDFTAGIQIVTAAGNDASANPVDLDVDLGRYGRPFSAAINLGYLQWRAAPTLSLTGGRMMNPYFKSDLIFAPDLSLDGLAIGYTPRLPGGLGAFVNGGVHPLQTGQSGPFNTASDQVLYALQGGAEWTSPDESRLRVAAAYYDFAGIQGKLDPVYPANNTLNDASAPLFRQLGNTMFDVHFQENVSGSPNAPLYAYAAQFRLVNLGAQYELTRYDPMRLTIQLDWVRNIGFNAAEIAQRLGPAVASLPYFNGPNGAHINGVNDARTNGYFVNVRLGAPELRRLGQWQIYGGVRYLERDAVPDAFTAPDYRLGGTDNQATFLGMNVGLSRATSVSLRYIAARSIDSAPKFGVDTWQLDLNARF
jgi:hypothetical protein